METELPLKESNLIIENESHIRISEMKPYNKVNHKMENFFIKKTSFCEPSADTLNNEIRLFEEFLVVGVNKADFEPKLQGEEPRTKLVYLLF